MRRSAQNRVVNMRAMCVLGPVMVFGAASMSACEGAPVDQRPQAIASPGDVSSGLGADPALGMSFAVDATHPIDQATVDALTANLTVRTAAGDVLTPSFDTSRMAAAAAQGGFPVLTVRAPGDFTGGWAELVIPSSLQALFEGSTVANTGTNGDEAVVRFRSDSQPVLRQIEVCPDGSIGLSFSEPVRLTSGALSDAVVLTDQSSKVITCHDGLPEGGPGLEDGALLYTWPLNCEAVAAGDFSLQITEAVQSASDIPVCRFDSTTAGVNLAVNTGSWNQTSTSCFHWNQP